MEETSLPQEPVPAAAPTVSKHFNVLHVVKGIILGLFGFMVFYYFVFEWIFGPNIIVHIGDLIAVGRTEDQITAQADCGDVSLEVLHWDEADKGAPATIDTTGTDPHIVQHDTLIGYEKGTEVFDIPTRGKHWVSPYVSADLPIDGAGASFVIDRDGFSKMNAEPAYYRASTAIIFDTSSGFDKDRIEPFARCYASHAAAFDAAWKMNVAVVTAPGTGIQADTFSCPDGHSVQLEAGGYARLDGVTQNIIGIAGSDGSFYPFDRDAAVASIGIDKVPYSQRTLDAWSTCRNAKGVDFRSYVHALDKNVIYLGADAEAQSDTITFTHPAEGEVLSSTTSATVSWTVPASVRALFPDDFGTYLFIGVTGTTTEGKAARVSIGDGNRFTTGTVQWNIPLSISHGTLAPGTYHLSWYLQAEPSDTNRLCAVTIGPGDCGPNDADTAIMQRAKPFKGVSGTFTIR